jgi:hypothetical protein
VKIYCGSGGGAEEKGKTGWNSLSFPPKLMVFWVSPSPPLNASVLFCRFFFESHLVYDQTQCSGALVPLLTLRRSFIKNFKWKPKYCRSWYQHVKHLQNQIPLASTHSSLQTDNNSNQFSVLIARSEQLTSIEITRGKYILTKRCKQLLHEFWFKRNSSVQLLLLHHEKEYHQPIATHYSQVTHK